MSFLSLTVILVSLLVIREFHSIDGSVEQIYEKVKQEVEDLIDSRDYESVDEIVKNSKVKVKYFDYYVPTSAKPTQLTTTIPVPIKVGGNKSQTYGSDVAPAHSGDKTADGEESDSIVIIILGVLGGVVIVVIVGVICIFIYVRKSKTATNRNVRKKPKRSDSRQSLESIVTVASDSGIPIKKGGSAAGATPSKEKAVPKKK